MATTTIRSIPVSRVADQPAGGYLNLPARRSRRRSLDALRALETVGEPCTYRILAPDASAVPADQLTAQDSTEIIRDLAHIDAMNPPPLDALVRMLYAASSHGDRSRVAPALDRLLSYVDYWSAASPGRVAALFERLTPSRLVRAVGQTLLASTRLAVNRSDARSAFLSNFLEDLRVRGTPEATIARLRKGLEE